MRVGIIGVNHKLADLQTREMLAKVCQRRFGAAHSNHPDHAFVLLSTCNRTEIYFSSEDLAVTHTYILAILRNEVEHDFDQKLYSYFGHDCFFHLTRVTTGLDSAVIAETEIQGQVKSAYETSIEYRKLPYELHYVFQKALRIGKKIRAELPIKPGMPDLEHAIYNTGMTILTHENKKILFVGASNINKKIINFFKTKKLNDISICNRSYDKAKSLANLYNLKCLNWTELHSWHEFDWVIVGTASPEYLLTQNQLSSKFHPKLMMDLSVPRNVDPALGNVETISLLNIDQINHSLLIRKQHLAKTLSSAERIVTHSIKQHIDLFHNKQSSPFRLLVANA